MAEMEIIMPKGLKDLEDKIALADQRAPGRIIEGMDKIGRKVIKVAREGTPEGPDKKKKKSKRLKYNYRAEPTSKEGGEWVKNIRNKAPHFHLVKFGHRLVRKGTVVGAVRGVDYFEKAVKGAEADINKEYEKMFDKIMKDILE